MTTTLGERFWSKVRKTATCWLWTAALNSWGYGAYRCDDGRVRGAHVVAWEAENGPVPEGMELDHVKERGCRHRHCVRPDHLEPVTRGENQRRGESPSGRHSRQARCHLGHAFDYVDTRGKRVCRTCRNLSKRRAKARVH